MKYKIIVLLGLVCVLSLLLAACSGTTLTPQTEEPKSAENVVTQEPTVESVPTEEPTAQSVVTEVPKAAGPRTGDIAPDFTLPDSNGNEVSLADTLQENEQVVIVFYYGIGCTPCIAQLSEIENDRAGYEEKGAQVIAIAVQSETHAEYTRKTVQAQFPILADGDHAVAEAFGVNEEDGLSTPSVFIINKDQQIVWSEISHIEGSGCGTERVPSQTILENLPAAVETVSSLNPIMTPDGDQVGESELERGTDKILLKFEACCVTPGNVYTAWWLIGDVTKPMSAVKTLLATGLVAEEEQFKLELELKVGAGGIENPLDGVRLAVLDHGLATGDPLQLSTPGGGCTSMPCPVAFETSHAAPE